MDRNHIICILSEHLAVLRTQYPIKSLALFGSVARGEATADSDVDILAEFAEPVSYFHLGDMEEELQGLLGCKVDLVTTTGIRDQFKARIYGEAIYV